MLLPSVLLVAAGTAFGGLAVLPASAAPAPARVSAAAAMAPVPLAAPAPANVELYSALSQGLAVANKPKPKPVVKPSPRPAAAKASRDRKPVGTIAQGAKAARPGIGRLTSGYGRRWGRLHAGIDLASGIGSPVRAAAAGTVLSAGSEGGYGRCVRITHADGTVTVYAHMSALLVNDGERVEAGQQIGREGNTGHSTGPHLHFEVRVNGSPIDPIPWLRKRGIVL
ncbi:MAG: rane protein [Frankiales bacterium]|nr:rane protein [Frankiales bacterium]